MSIDWGFINEQTKSFRTLDVFHDSDGQTVLDVTFAGLQVKLSDLNKYAPSNGGSTLAIWADTLIIDYPTFDWQACVIIARCIDCSMLRGAPMPIRVPAAGQTSVCQFLLGESAGQARYQLSTTANKTGSSEFTVPIGLNPLQVGYFFVQADGSTRHQVSGSIAELQDLLARPWALNSMKASFTAASWLMESSDPADVNTARSMLNWVVSCIRALGPGGGRLTTQLSELYGQAAALLVTLNVSSGAKYVPVLSADFYNTQAVKLLDVLQTYENNLNTLTIQADIKTAIAQVSATLGNVAQDEEKPWQTDFANLTSSITNLNSSIYKLQMQFELQNIEAGTGYTLMASAIASMKVTQFLEACFKFAVDVVKLGISVGTMAASGGAQGSPGDMLDPLVGMVTNGYAAIDAATSSFPNDQLPNKAKALMQVQSQLMTSFVTSSTLWNTTLNDKLVQLPMALGAVAIDPGLAWDNYMIEAERALANMALFIGSGTDSGTAQAAANDYLASLKILAQYGKAINAKFISFTELLARATVVRAQIAAAKNVQARWQELQAAAKTDEEKLAALKGMIKVRTAAITRSIFVAWTNYRNAYYYMFFSEPVSSIRMDMNAAQLKDAFASVSLGAAQLLGDVADSQKVRLPQENVSISFRFDIVRQGARVTPNQAVALLSPATATAPASLTWCIPIGDPQLRGVLPRNGCVAIWISKAQFWIDGVQANSRGKVIVDVSTSGSYVNGFGPSLAKEFVNKGVQANFAYDVASQQAYIHWQIPQAVYMTPTPFTQWSLVFDGQDGGDPSNARTLRMDLTVAYRAQS